MSAAAVMCRCRARSSRCWYSALNSASRGLPGSLKADAWSPASPSTSCFLRIGELPPLTIRPQASLTVPRILLGHRYMQRRLNPLPCSSLLNLINQTPCRGEGRCAPPLVPAPLPESSRLSCRIRSWGGGVGGVEPPGARDEFSGNAVVRGRCGDPIRLFRGLRRLFRPCWFFLLAHQVGSPALCCRCRGHRGGAARGRSRLVEPPALPAAAGERALPPPPRLVCLPRILHRNGQASIFHGGGGGGGGGTARLPRCWRWHHDSHKSLSSIHQLPPPLLPATLPRTTHAPWGARAVGEIFL